MAKSYLELDIYKVSFDLFLRTHHYSLKLPKYETYELGSQLRRSADSVNSNIVEGYGRRRYKNDFLKFLIYAHSSNDETVNHLRKLQKIYPELSDEASELVTAYNNLGKMINKFIQYVEKNWNIPRN